MTPVVQSGLNMSWLDQELRKQKALISDLRDVIDSQQVTISDQHQRIVTLEDRFTRLETQLARIPAVEESLQHTRDEIAIALSDMRQEQQKREADFVRNRQSEREQQTRQIQEIQMDLARIAVLEQSLAARQAEGQRVQELLLRFEVQLEEVNLDLERKEDQARQLSQAIDRNRVGIAQTNEETQSLGQVQQGYADRMLSAEGDLTKAGQDIQELQAMRGELTQQQDALAESQRRADRARVQTMTEWGRRIETVHHQLEGWTEQLRYYGDQHERIRRVLREVQELSQSVSQQQEHLGQLQRLAEEQLRRDLRDAQAENDRRWSQEADRREAAQVALGEQQDMQDVRLSASEEAHEATVRRIETLQRALDVLSERHASDHDQVVAMQRRSWRDLARITQAVLDTLPLADEPEA